MNDEFLQKQIAETRYEIFPLDKLLPLETVDLIFQEEYTKSEDKNLFFRDRKFQRLREGYFLMFVAISLQDISGNPHLVVFPSRPDNDVYIAERTNSEDEEVPKLIAYEFDIKEYTNWSSNFDEFMQNSIIPKINIYNIAIPIYRKIDGTDLELLINYLKNNNLTRRIWILGLPSDDVEDSNISDLTVIDKDGIVYHKIIDLKSWIDKTKTPMVYQNTIRFRQPRV